MARLEPSHIDLIGNELAIAWNDGRETYHPLEQLRRDCPCATCKGEPDATGKVYVPNINYDPNRSFTVKSWRIIGGYAIAPTWGDGHETGLYTFDSFRK